jgi:uncharacterized protein YhhL (DUF1145 family)
MERSCLTPCWQLATSYLLAVTVEAFLVVVEVAEILLVLVEQLQMLLSLSMISRLELISCPGETVAILGFRVQHMRQVHIHSYHIHVEAFIIHAH